jgi:hypothetical protein
MALGFLVLVGTLFFADVLFGFREFYLRDLTRYYYPTKQILRDIVLHGEFPYWNRFFSGGQPIAANPEHEVFYPLTWLILLPSYDFGFRLHILIHVYIGLVGMYALLRSMDVGRFAAVIGALTWGVGGLYLSYINLLPILFCAAWLPLICLFTRKFLLRPNLRHFALAALFLGMSFLVGEPTTIAQIGFLLGMYGLYRAWYSERRIAKAITRTTLVGLVTAAGLLVGAAQAIPALDHVRDSARARAFEFSLVSCWSMPPSKLGELIFPNILGHISIDRVMWYWGGGLYPGMGSPFIFSIYMGLLTIALCVGGAFARPRGGRFVLLLSVISLLLALGGHTPLMDWLYKAHVASSIRYPEKFAMLGIFALTVFAAQMLQRLLDGDERVRDGVIGFLAATTLVAVSMAVFSFMPQYAKFFRYVWGLTPGPNADRMISITRTDWIVAAVRGMIAVALVATVAMRKYRRWWMAVAALFVVIDLAVVTEELNPRMPRRFFDSPPAASMLPANKADYRLFHEADWYGTEEIARQYFSTGDAVYWVVRNGLFPMTPAGSKIRTVLERDYDKTALLPTVDLTDSIWDVKRNGRPDWAEIFMSMSNAWFRAEYRPFEPEKKRVKGNFKEAIAVKMVEGPHYARYYFADQLVTIRDRADFVSRLSRSSYSRKAGFVTIPAFSPASGRVLGIRESANAATIDVEANGEAFLIISVTPHKYWRATIDGKPAPLRVVNIGYQGLTLSPGKHRIEMRYWNDLARIGMLLSILTLGVLTVLAIRRPRRHLTIEPLNQEAYEEVVHVDALGHAHPAEEEGQRPATDSSAELEETRGAPEAGVILSREDGEGPRD